ncbi:MAG: ATP-binding protein, partial [Spirochaetota bacterium]
KQIAVKKIFPNEEILIRGNENKLKQLFINLMMNGIEALLDHGILEIILKKDLKKGYAEVSIIDSGYGIPLEIQEEIFTPFFSTKMTKKNTGLGLSICQHIAEAHNGVITFESNPGERTCFTVKLPLRELSAPIPDPNSLRVNL